MSTAVSGTADELKPVYPLTAPGMPLPGRDYIDEANRRTTEDVDSVLTGKGKNVSLTAGPVLKDLIYDSLYGRGDLQIAVTVKNAQKRPLNVISGHRWAAAPNERSPGPEPCDVMLIGKVLGEHELKSGRCFAGPTGRLLIASLEKLRAASEARQWYITPLCKTVLPDPGGTWRDSYAKTFLHLLHQEFRIVRPSYILCLGSDALKALFGKNMTQSKCDGRVLEYEIDLRHSADEEPNSQTALVMGCLNPASVLRTPDQLDKMEQTLARFIQLTQGIRWDKCEDGLDHRVIDNEYDLRSLTEEIKAGGTNQIIAADAEWHGEHPQNNRAYLRTIQVSWKHKGAACIVLNGVGGVPAFQTHAADGSFTTDGGFDVALKLIRELFKDQRPCGHYFAADLEWFRYYGLDEVAEAFAPAADWEDCRNNGGLDTALMAHAVDETGDFALTAQTLQRTGAPRYDVELLKWKDNYCKRNGLKAKDLDGYGMCPPEVLYPYALYDADVTRRIALSLMDELDFDRFGNNCWKPFWVSQKAALGTLEMKTTGLVLDRDKVDEMTSVYMEAKRLLAEKIRRRANWPELNLESVYQIREFLFGACNNGSRNKDGTVRRLRPESARSLRVVPMITTEKRPRLWQTLTPDERRQFSPSTNKTALGMLVHRGSNLNVRRKEGIAQRDYKDIVQAVRDYRFVSQVLKSVLRPPLLDDDGFVCSDEQGRLLYKGGIPGAICGDGRIRTTFYQTKETGRWSSVRPPLHNLSKRRDPDLRRILGKAYPGPLRSILCAPPGYMLVEADYVGAELFAMAMLSGDPAMLEHARRNQLPESHPDFYDIHSNVAVLAFGLDCPPTKGGLAALGKKHLRVVAKSVIFGFWKLALFLKTQMLYFTELRYSVR